MNEKDSNISQNKKDSENTQGVTLFSLIISIGIGAFTLMKSFFSNTASLIATAIFVVILVILIRVASSKGILRIIGRWLSGK